MSRAVWGIGCCLLAVGVGCEKLFTFTDRPAGPGLARSLVPAIPAEALVVEYILLERPLGDAFLDRGLWATTRATWSPETLELLSRNGLQAGVLTGNLPAEFQLMLDNKAEVVDKPQCMTFNHRKEDVIPTAGPFETCKFDLLQDLAGKPAPISLTDARCGLLVRPLPLPEGRVKLWCEPRIQHGNREEKYRPSEDGTQFTKFEEVPTEKYPRLGFEVVLQTNDCLVIGCIAGQQDSLGRILFEAESQGHPRQRVLAIRARQLNVNPTADLPVILPPGRIGAATCGR